LKTSLASNDEASALALKLQDALEQLDKTKQELATLSTEFEKHKTVLNEQLGNAHNDLEASVNRCKELEDKVKTLEDNIQEGSSKLTQ
jgi:hypothetical protein